MIQNLYINQLLNVLKNINLLEGNGRRTIADGNFFLSGGKIENNRKGSKLLSFPQVEITMNA